LNREVETTDQDKDSSGRQWQTSARIILLHYNHITLEVTKMKTKNMLVAALLVSAAGLSAFSISASANTDTTSGKTRAQVRAELVQARADGFQPNSEAPEVFYKAPAQSGKTRAQVRAELIQARAEGFQPSSEAPEVYSKPVVQAGKTRAQVRAELLQARAEEAASGHHVSPEE
jgi:hypothetical protein